MRLLCATADVFLAFPQPSKCGQLGTKVPLYGLRHMGATLLLQAGVHPKIVAERLGHSSTKLTLDVTAT
jgi:integrase